MIELRDVSHAFDGRMILRDVNLRLEQRRIGVVGANGSGKSTFARLLNGLLVPTRGRVLVDGLDTRTDGKAVRRAVGFVFQNPDSQIVFPIVSEDLVFGLKPLKLPRAELDARIDTALRRYGMERYRDHPCHHLSGGEKQLLALSSVLIMEPRHVVLDEPTTLLDLRNRNRVVEALAGLPQRIIVVSHDLDLFRDFDRVIVFDGGRVVADDDPAPALAHYVSLMS
jgi:biotin transport system ATP-binding protein